MALTNAERKRRYIQNLKLTGLYESYKKKKADHARGKRRTRKIGLTKIGKTMRAEILKKHRDKCRKRVYECRQRKKAGSTRSASALSSSQTHSTGTTDSTRDASALSSSQTNSTGTTCEDTYKTSSALSKALAKVKRALPSSIEKRKAIISKLFHSLDESIQLDIVQKNSAVKSKPSNAISETIVNQVKWFYERDDISRMSPNVKDTRYFRDPATGKKELKPMRHLMYRLSEIYALFIEEYEKGESGTVPLKVSKFCALRPVHVKLVNDMPHNVCYCLYHTNFIECCIGLHRSVPEFPLYGEELFDFLLCDIRNKDCWTRSCVQCTAEIIKSKLDDKFQSLDANPISAHWVLWKQDELAKRYVKVNVNGSITDLIQHFINILDQFIKHVYTKRAQAKCFEGDRKEMEETENNYTANLHFDWAENWTCESQDEIQSAHWNQRTISLFTIALKYFSLLRSKAFVSDNTDHSKNTIVAYLYKILVELPKEIRILKIWSDGPSAQFKNKFIAAAILLFEDLFPVKIIWNYFATSHGKGSVDGIGAVVKNKVRRMVMSRKVIVNNAHDFVTAFCAEDSLIQVSEVSVDEIDKINDELEVNYVFETAKAVPNISRFHQLQVVDNKLMGFATSEEGYKYLNRQ